MSFLFKNSLRNSYRESCAQQPNVPTNTHINYYYSIFQYIMFCVSCWNVVFVLEHIGTLVSYFLGSVGIKKRPNNLLEGTNKNTTIHYQTINAKKHPVLDRWYVGTENDRHGNEINFL